MPVHRTQRLRPGDKGRRLRIETDRVTTRVAATARNIGERRFCCPPALWPCSIPFRIGQGYRLGPKSGLPDFGIKLSKSETSDFDAIHMHGRCLGAMTPKCVSRSSGNPLMTSE